MTKQPPKRKEMKEPAQEKNFTLRCPAEVLEAVRAKAKKQKRSLNSHIVFILENYLTNNIEEN